MPTPDYQTIMRPLLMQLADGQLHTLSELHETLCKHFKLTPEEVKERISSGKQTVMRNRVGWAKTYLSKAGLLEVPVKANCKITELGRKALDECPERIDNKYLRQFEAFLEFTRPKKAEKGEQQEILTAESDITPDEQIDAACRAINQSLADELITTIKSSNPDFFERVVVDLMIAMGYGGSRKDAGQATQATNDDGIDGIIKEDKLGLDIIYLQAKRWQNTVHRPEIDKFIGSLTRNRARKGVFITTSSFSAGAIEAIAGLDMKVVLIDGPQLAELMIEHGLGVFDHETYVIKKIDSDYFNEDN